MAETIGYVPVIAKADLGFCKDRHTGMLQIKQLPQF